MLSRERSLVTFGDAQTACLPARARAFGNTCYMPKYWSQDVTEHSNALDLESGVFSKRTAHAIAVSLKHSADESKRRKGTAFQSAMSMLNFYINRAGKHLPENRLKILEAAKDELRKLYGRTPRDASAARTPPRRRTTSAKPRTR